MIVLQNKITLVVACDLKYGIGKDNLLPWDIPEDMKRFRDITSQGTVVMGSKTASSIYQYRKGKGLLPNRRNIVLTRDNNVHYIGGEILHQYLDVLKIPGEIFIIGGGQIYSLFLPFCTKIYMTRIQSIYECDTFFPNSWVGDFMLTDSSVMQEKNNVSFLFQTWIRCEKAF